MSAGGKWADSSLLRWKSNTPTVHSCLVRNSRSPVHQHVDRGWSEDWGMTSPQPKRLWRKIGLAISVLAEWAGSGSVNGHSRVKVIPETELHPVTSPGLNLPVTYIFLLLKCDSNVEKMNVYKILAYWQLHSLSLCLICPFVGQQDDQGSASAKTTQSFRNKNHFSVHWMSNLKHV